MYPLFFFHTLQLVQYSIKDKLSDECCTSKCKFVGCEIQWPVGYIIRKVLNHSSCNIAISVHIWLTNFWVHNIVIGIMLEEDLVYSFFFHFQVPTHPIIREIKFSYDDIKLELRRFITAPVHIKQVQTITFEFQSSIPVNLIAK